MSEDRNIINGTVVNETHTKQTRTETFEISGDKVMDFLKEVVNKANVRRISIKKDSGETLVDIPLTIGAAGALIGLLLAPYLVAVAAIAALFIKIKVVIERIDDGYDT